MELCFEGWHCWLYWWCVCYLSWRQDCFIRITDFYATTTTTSESENEGAVVSFLHGTKRKAMMTTAQDESSTTTPTTTTTTKRDDSVTFRSNYVDVLVGRNWSHWVEVESFGGTALRGV